MERDRKPAPLRTAHALAAAAAVVLAGACSSPSPEAPSPEAPPPNLLLIVADDLGYNDLAINNSNTEIRTSTLDALARSGVRFEHHYSDSVCSPSRAALLTGLHPARLGYVPNARGISPQIDTLAELLRARGYGTWHIGKWHIGDTVREAWPDRQGFEHWFGFLNQWYLPGVMHDGALVPGEPRYLDPWLMTDGDDGRRYLGHLEDILTDKAVAVLGDLAATGKPWFLNLWFYAPHAPVTPSAAMAARYPDTPAGRYRALVEQLDTNIARVLDALDRSGQRESTLVVLVSDNGGTNKEVDNNYPFFGEKATFHEGGVRTPLIIRRPREPSAGLVRDDVATIQDIFPTVLAQLGAPVPPDLDGIDLFARDAERAAPRRLFWEAFASGRFGYAVLDAGRMRMYRPWPYTPWEAPASLIDYARAPAPIEDLAPTQPERVTELTQAWRDWHRDVHRLRLDFTRDASGRGELRGLDFLRTPGFGGFGFAVTVPAGFTGTVARQQGIWSLEAGADGVITLDLQGREIRGRSDPVQCRSAVISGNFTRRISNREQARDRMEVWLDLNGSQAGKLDLTEKLDDSGFSAPTEFGLGSDAGMNHEIPPPLMLSVAVHGSEVWSAAALHAQLCGAARAGQQTK